MSSSANLADISCHGTSILPIYRLSHTSLSIDDSLCHMVPLCQCQHSKACPADPPPPTHLQSPKEEWSEWQAEQYAIIQRLANHHIKEAQQVQASWYCLCCRVGVQQPCTLSGSEQTILRLCAYSDNLFKQFFHESTLVDAGLSHTLGIHKRDLDTSSHNQLWLLLRSSMAQQLTPIDTASSLVVW
eukprot:GHUV01043005.1.p1 GENE.GHUV01043005.1~~GHUV01043005.1.p1  ORF type:complete len:186 (+),score=23.91 GHUV01043005.1:1224-1781(+)